MPRRPRLIIENQPHHVVQRGHNRKAVFFAKEDYLFYRECAGLAAERHGCLIHAYCLMTNHIHLLVTPPSPLALSRMVAEPQDYPWSSYELNGRAAPDDGLITPHALYESLGASAPARAAAYRDFVSQAWRPGDLELIRQSIQGSWALGGAEFCARVERETGQDAAPSPRGGDRRSGNAPHTQQGGALFQ